MGRPLTLPQMKAARRGTCKVGQNPKRDGCVAVSGDGSAGKPVTEKVDYEQRAVNLERMRAIPDDEALAKMTHEDLVDELVKVGFDKREAWDKTLSDGLDAE